MAKRPPEPPELPAPNPGAWRRGLAALRHPRAGRTGQHMVTGRDRETGFPTCSLTPGVPAIVYGDPLCGREGEIAHWGIPDERPTMFDAALLEELAAADPKLQAALAKAAAEGCTPAALAAARAHLDRVFADRLLVAICEHYDRVAPTLTHALVLKVHHSRSDT